MPNCMPDDLPQCVMLGEMRTMCGSWEADDDDARGFGGG
jgi:hypothetical protein